MLLLQSLLTCVVLILFSHVMGGFWVDLTIYGEIWSFTSSLFDMLFVGIKVRDRKKEKIFFFVLF